MRTFIIILGLLGVTTLPVAGEERALFDGKTLKGWTNKDGKAPGAGWKVEDNCIVRSDKLVTSTPSKASRTSSFRSSGRLSLAATAA